MSGQNINLKRAIAILLVSLVFLGWGDTWDQIKKGSKDIASVEAEFVQEKHMEILSRPLVSKGKFYFQLPGSIRWEYRSPVRSILLMHGGSIKRYVKKGDKMVTESTAGMQSMQVVIGEITQWMKGDFDKNPSFAPQLRQGRVILLTPRDKSLADIIQRIELKLGETPGTIRTVTIYESKNSYTVLGFAGIKLNKSFPDSLFLEL